MASGISEIYFGVQQRKFYYGTVAVGSAVTPVQEAAGSARTKIVKRELFSVL